ncbi:hypothetical protein [Marinomonas sp.]|uniref:hypothetical protein n=1 Tax=Marinomonas sp. TaxID=1904862 RepID=UPI003BACEE00
MPTWDQRLIDLERAANSQDYCDELIATAAKHGVVISELASLSQAAASTSRVPSGHPEGYLEAFANLYREFAL